jgi:hypothetical protein
MSLLLMQALNTHFKGKLDLAIQIFNNQYERKFFHQLVSSQLDMDRLDYLQRDCFFTGVVEGNVGVRRILKMLDVHDDRIVVEEKGIYSIENFLNARRLMYWQVYLHKTTVSSEQMIVRLMERARWLTAQGERLFATEALSVMLANTLSLEDFKTNPDYLKAFAALDDFDIWGSIKAWAAHPDKVLRKLSNMLLDRKLFRTTFSDEPFSEERLEAMRLEICEKYDLNYEEAYYLFANGAISNAGYVSGAEAIYIKTKKGEVIDIALASDLPNIEALSKIVRKFYVSYPKKLSL